MIRHAHTTLPEKGPGVFRSRCLSACILAVCVLPSLMGARRLRSRRGSTMVEATMVLPLLILAVITCVMICMFFYDTTIHQCHLHEALRCEAGEQTHLTTNLNKPKYDAASMSITARNGLIFTTVHGTTRNSMIHQGILPKRPVANTESQWQAANGARYVRIIINGKDVIMDIKDKAVNKSKDQVKDAAKDVVKKK